MLETSIEKRACQLLQARGCLTPKMGTEGWPDRLVIWAPGRHFWIEFKNEGGTLTPAQKVRIPMMVKKGEEVWVVTSAIEALALLDGRKP